jgi:hypothetical protein
MTMMKSQESFTTTFEWRKIGNNNTKIGRGGKTTIEGNDEIKVDNRGGGGIDVRFYQKKKKRKENEQTIANSIEGYVLVTSVSRRSLAFQTRPVLNYGRSKSSGKGLGITDVFLFKIEIGHFYPQTANQITQNKN